MSPHQHGGTDAPECTTCLPAPSSRLAALLAEHAPMVWSGGYGAVRLHCRVGTCEVEDADGYVAHLQALAEDL